MEMFQKVLIANRGEIAVRILRACGELGLGTVAVCSEADRKALHVQLADQSVCVGPAASAKSYLNMDAILSACKITGAQAVHPGVGFLSENAEFAERCEQQGICFIGPKPQVIRAMGNKASAKRAATRAGVPTVPGSPGVVLDRQEAEKCAEKIGYPILIKACAGGGGRGIRQVDCVEQLPEALAITREEATRFFGCGDVYLEKKLIHPRHVEVQVLADNFGNVVHLGERDCSLQRRHQKVLEECPSPSGTMTAQIREKMGEAAVRVAREVGYTGVGTVEFLLDQDGSFYFMEMNTRVQVEHPITEMVWGIDLVKWQLRVAQGQRLDFDQKDLCPRGHAIECRINAETPEKNFAPSVGTLSNLRLPGGNGIRLDTAVYEGYSIPPYYDNLLAKLVAYAPTREEAAEKMRQALKEFSVSGVDTNALFQMQVLASKAFQSAHYDICTLESATEAIACL